MSNSKLAKLTSPRCGFFVLFAVFVGCIGLFTASYTDTMFYEFGISESLTFVICICTFVLANAWSVLGSGRYAYRLLFAHVCAVIVFAGLGTGVAWSKIAKYSYLYFANYPRVTPYVQGWIVYGAVFAICVLPTVSLVSHFPFLGLRWFGYRLTWNQADPDNAAYSLRNIFFILTLVAVAGAAMQLNCAFGLEPESYTKQIAGNVPVLDKNGVALKTADGSVVYRSTEIDEAEFNQRAIATSVGRRREVQFRYAMVSICALFITLLTMPLFVFSFRGWSGMIGIVVYTSIPLLTYAVIMLRIGQWDWEGVILITAIAYGTSFFLVIPLQIAKRCGLRLVRLSRSSLLDVVA